VRIGTNEVIPAELIIVAIGIVPAVEPLLAVGAVENGGVLVNEYGRTSLPDVYAIGDCAVHSSGSAGRGPVRIESVQNATDMAATVAKAILGKAEPHRAVPWFWSNQYGLRLQMTGLSADHDDRVVRGDVGARSFSVIYRKAGRVIAMDCVNAPRDFMQGRELVARGAAAEPHELSDTTVALKSVGKLVEVY
jgi:3-phenylpropionate/trans-cinnamate dioxygenase ferredoxin reductase subunit